MPCKRERRNRNWNESNSKNAWREREGVTRFSRTLPLPSSTLFYGGRNGVSHCLHYRDGEGEGEGVREKKVVSFIKMTTFPLFQKCFFGRKKKKRARAVSCKVEWSARVDGSGSFVGGCGLRSSCPLSLSLVLRKTRTCLSVCRGVLFFWPFCFPWRSTAKPQSSSYFILPNI